MICESTAGSHPPNSEGSLHPAMVRRTPEPCKGSSRKSSRGGPCRADFRTPRLPLCSTRLAARTANCSVAPVRAKVVIQHHANLARQQVYSLFSPGLVSPNALKGIMPGGRPVKPTPQMLTTSPSAAAVQLQAGNLSVEVTYLL